MAFWMGKAMGGMVGLMTGGPFGMMMGAFVGHWFDQSVEAFASVNPMLIASATGTDFRKLFLGSMFRVMGRIAKLSGRVTEQEIAACNYIMDRMQLHGSVREQAIAYFREGKEPDTDIDTDLKSLNRFLTPVMAQMFVEVELTVIYADGEASSEELAYLSHVCKQLGISQQQLDGWHSRLRAAMSDAKAQSSGGLTLQQAYQTLGVNESVDAATLKRTYRKLMSQNHPDKLAASGLPEQMLEMAKDKTQEIQKAYETIRKARGF
ncbi:MAG: co-chaperone DjlA [Oceanobacter sp.]